MDSAKTTEAEFLDHLAHWLDLEQFGTLMAEMLADRFSDGRQDDFALLAELERRTAAWLARILSGHGYPKPPAAALEQRATEAVDRMLALDWTVVLTGLRGELVQWIKALSAAEKSAPAGFEAISRHLIEHEEAWLDVVDGQLNGQRSDSLLAVRNLLQGNFGNQP